MRRAGAERTREANVQALLAAWDLRWTELDRYAAVRTSGGRGTPGRLSTQSNTVPGIGANHIHDLSCFAGGGRQFPPGGPPTTVGARGWRPPVSARRPANHGRVAQFPPGGPPTTVGSRHPPRRRGRALVTGLP